MSRSLLPILAALLLAPSLRAQEVLPRPRPSQHGTVSTILPIRIEVPRTEISRSR